MPLINITRQEEGGYRCTADNGVGSPDTKDVFITVQCKCWNCIYFFNINFLQGKIIIIIITKNILQRKNYNI